MIIMGIGDWGLGIWGLGMATGENRIATKTNTDHPQAQIQTPTKNIAE